MKNPIEVKLKIGKNSKSLLNVDGRKIENNIHEFGKIDSVRIKTKMVSAFEIDEVITILKKARDKIINQV